MVTPRSGICLLLGTTTGGPLVCSVAVNPAMSSEILLTDESLPYNGYSVASHGSPLRCSKHTVGLEFKALQSTKCKWSNTGPIGLSDLSGDFPL